MRFVEKVSDAYVGCGDTVAEVDHYIAEIKHIVTGRIVYYISIIQDQPLNMMLKKPYMPMLNLLAEMLLISS